MISIARPLLSSGEEAAIHRILASGQPDTYTLDPVLVEGALPPTGCPWRNDTWPSGARRAFLLIQERDNGCVRRLQ